MILIVEDEPSLASLLQEYLQHSGLDSEVIADGLLAIDSIKQLQPDLVILDLMLPNKSGLDIYRELRSFSQVPVVMATAKVDEIDRLIGLELGADDYICKPYSPREVVARVKNVLRRTQGNATSNQTEPVSPAHIEKLSLNEQQMRVRIDDQAITLTPAEFKLLLHFSHHPDVVFNRDQLIDRIYSDGRVVTDRTIDSHIKNLRKKILAVNPEYDWIKSVYGVGYRFELEQV
ncbi:response regulator [Vibrio hippocampi]|uniref:Transcriptional regulatory protein BaeR n=1 Tax=Vibrio hippocampi TaxID=654686 RepID=A0ABN8DLS4_9VIBR|nr:response regulator [Vibrio hippocampi]CAH0529728.1 Transcriptional regulatory protein BaeR [Vibrio hippocampi]